VLKINEAELDYLTGRHADDVERVPADPATEPGMGERVNRIARDVVALIDREMATAAITMGVAGAILACKEGTWHGALSDTAGLEVVDTVGAGDAFFAGMIHAMVGGLDPPAVLVEAISSATAKLLVHGAGTFSSADQQRFRPLVHVRRIG
jgi:sugar/nucleoside kinase (ribokinase family)